MKKLKLISYLTVICLWLTSCGGNQSAQFYGDTQFIVKDIEATVYDSIVKYRGNESAGWDFSFYNPTIYGKKGQFQVGDTIELISPKQLRELNAK